MSSQQPKVKICGITREKDAALACELGADAIGFIFYEKSPRAIGFEAAAAIAARLPAHVARIGVFVEPTIEYAQTAISEAGLTAVQLHGKHTFDHFRHWQAEIICAINVAPEMKIEQLDACAAAADALLLDGFKAGSHGGTGRTVDWHFAKQAAQRHRIFLAGGLSPANIIEALKIAAPFAVDINSGVEDAPGIKNHNKIKQLFKALGRRG